VTLLRGNGEVSTMGPKFIEVDGVVFNLSHVVKVSFSGGVDLALEAEIQLSNGTIHKFFGSHAEALKAFFTPRRETT